MSTTESTRNARGLSDAFRNVAEQVRPSVVQIMAIDDPPYQGRNDGAGRPDLDRMPEQFRDMLPQRPDRPSPGARGPRMGQGTGVIATSDGMIITNNHVVQDASPLYLPLPT